MDDEVQISQTKTKSAAVTPKQRRTENNHDPKQESSKALIETLTMFDNMFGGFSSSKLKPRK
jgi:hypothetical protein